MAAASIKAQCSICNHEEETYICRGCSETFCFNHLTDHRETIHKEFNQIEDDYNLFRQTLNGQKDDQKIRLLIQQIDEWQEDSINKIKQTAEACKQRLIKSTNEYLNDIESKLDTLTDEIKEIRKKNAFNEIHLSQLKENLNKLKGKLDKQSNVSIEQQPSALINKIFITKPFHKDTKWQQVGLTIAGGNGSVNQLNQLFHPCGIFIDDDENIYVADRGNHRIVEWKSNTSHGQIVAGGNGQGNQTNQLNGPMDMLINKENDSLIIADKENRRVMRWSRQNNANPQIIASNIDCWGLAMDKDGSLYISDYKKNEVRRWKKEDQNGTIIAGGNGEGNQLNQFNVPTFIFVDEDYSLYVSDSNNHRVMKWLKDATEGIVVAGGNSQGNSLTQLSQPRGVIVDHLDQIYVADKDNHRVMRWCRGSKEGTIVVGGNGEGEQSNQLNGPRCLSFDRQGNLYVTDYENHRIQKFEID